MHVRSLFASLFGMALFLFGCGPTDPSRVGGSGGTGGFATTIVSSSTTATSSSSGGTGGTGGGAVNALVNGPGVTEAGDLTNCVGVIPASNEDGAFARTVFGPWVTPFDLNGFRFMAIKGAAASVMNPWTLSLLMIPPNGPKPEDVSCAISMPQVIAQVNSFDAGDGLSALVLEGIIEAAPQDIGGYALLCIRESTGDNTAPTQLLMCGDPGSCTAADQWETQPAPDNSTEVQNMSIYGSNLCRPWATELF